MEITIKNLLRKIIQIISIIVLFIFLISVSFAEIKLNTYAEEQITFETFTTESGYDVTKVLDSGLPDEKSLVIVFLAEGFTKNEQDIFLDKVNYFIDYLKNVRPYNYFFNYISIYAVHTISNESGISGDNGNGQFACLDKNGNPVTNKCTPYNSTFNCEHGKDTFFKSYHVWRTVDNRPLFYCGNSGKARTIANSVSNSVNMIQVLANSSMEGGSGQIATQSQPVGVAVTSLNTSSSKESWCRTTVHEFGHSFGGLTDEYWNYLSRSESTPNITKNSNSETVKWSHLIGFEGIDVYKFTDNPNHNANPWYRPSQTCKMNSNYNDYCLVCEEVLINKIQSILGLKLYDTTILEDGTIRINKINFMLPKSFSIHPVIDKRVVTEIGDYAFENQSKIETIKFPSNLKTIGNYSFKNCTSLKKVITNDFVYSFGKGVFENCSSLTTIDFPNLDLKLDETLFRGCSSLKNVNIYCHSKTNYTDPSFKFIDCDVILNKNLVSPKKLHINSNILIWDNVESASYYEVSIFDKNTLISKQIVENTNQYDFSDLNLDEIELLNFMIVAKGEGMNDSEPSSTMPRAKVKFTKRTNSTNEILPSKYYLIGYPIPYPGDYLFPGYKYSKWTFTKLINGWTRILEWDFDNMILENNVRLYVDMQPCEHEFENCLDIFCDLCGQTREEDHQYEMKNTIYQHWQECTTCGKILNEIKLDHAAIDDGDCTTELRCECGVLLKKADEHKLEKNLIGNNICYIEKCINIDCQYQIKHEHNYNTGASNSTEKWIICGICNKEQDNSRIPIFELDINSALDNTNNCTMSFNLIKTIVMINLLFLGTIIFKKKTK